MDFLLMNSDGDLFDVMASVMVGETFSVKKYRYGNMPSPTTSFGEQLMANAKKRQQGLRCSGFVRLTPDRSDIYFAHATWDGFAYAGPRIFKHLNLSVNGVFSLESSSNSPGTIPSVDDWYLTSNGLGVFETSYSLYNESLYNLIVPQSLLYFWRAAAANRMATTGPQWVSLFLKYNSGTYNNEWMIVDSKLFSSAQKTSPLKANTLTVLEQTPGTWSVWSDMTSTLESQGYWASYNVPYFQSVWKLTGYEAAYRIEGDAFSWSKCPRAQIFARDGPNVATIADTQKMINYNNYQNDPLSLGSPCNAIACRDDLPYLDNSGDGSHPGGAYDGKVSAVSLSSSISTWARSGPTHDQEPVFCWSTAPKNLAVHLGQPDCFNFTWQLQTPVRPSQFQIVF